MQIEQFYSKDEILDVTDELKRATGDAVWTQKILDRFQRRIGRLDCFMKELKQIRRAVNYWGPSKFYCLIELFERED